MSVRVERGHQVDAYSLYQLLGSGVSVFVLFAQVLHKKQDHLPTHCLISVETCREAKLWLTCGDNRTRVDCSSQNHNLLTSTWCLSGFTGITGGAIEAQQSSGFNFNQSLQYKQLYLPVSWSYEHIPTYFVLCGVARDDHCHYFQSLGATAKAVDAGDVGTLVVNRLHKLNT